MRRVALAEDFGTVPPRLRNQRVEALSKGHRIWFAPADEGLYIEQKLDRVFRDPGQGNWSAGSASDGRSAVADPDSLNLDRCPGVCEGGPRGP
jgi:hypothetical protein